jgi:sulfur-carrier protein
LKCKRSPESLRLETFAKLGVSVKGKLPSMVRVILPFHLRNLARLGSELILEVQGPVTQRSILDELEAKYPMLRGAIRDQVTQQRRPFLRFFACEEDLSHESPDAPLPESIASGTEPFIVIGAIAGG